MQPIAPLPGHRPPKAELAAAEACARRIVEMPPVRMTFEGRVAIVFLSIFVLFVLVVAVR